MLIPLSDVQRMKIYFYGLPTNLQTLNPHETPESFELKTILQNTCAVVLLRTLRIVNEQMTNYYSPRGCIIHDGQGLYVPGWNLGPEKGVKPRKYEKGRILIVVI